MCKCMFQMKGRPFLVHPNTFTHICVWKHTRQWVSHFTGSEPVYPTYIESLWPRRRWLCWRIHLARADWCHHLETVLRIWRQCDMFDFSPGLCAAALCIYSVQSPCLSSYSPDQGSGFLALWVLKWLRWKWHCFVHFTRTYFSWECTHKSEFDRVWQEEGAQYSRIA